jgi:hypothetical protein
VDQTQSWIPSFMLAYYAFPRGYQFGERRCNDILTGETRRTRRKPCPSASLSTKNPTLIAPGAKPGLRGERPSINAVSHGTTIYDISIIVHSFILSFLPGFTVAYSPNIRGLFLSLRWLTALFTLCLHSDCK